MKCPYSYSVGTMFSQQIQSGVDIDHSVGEEMKQQLWELFKGTNTTTDYDWTHVSSEAKLEITTDTKTDELVAEVPPGKT